MRRPEEIECAAQLRSIVPITMAHHSAIALRIAGQGGFAPTIGKRLVNEHAPVSNEAKSRPNDAEIERIDALETKALSLALDHFSLTEPILALSRAISSRVVMARYQKVTMVEVITMNRE